MEEWTQWRKEIEDRLHKLEKDEMLKRAQIINEESESILSGIEEFRKKNKTPFLELIEQGKLLSDEDLHSLIASLEYEMQHRKLNCQFCGKVDQELVRGIREARICTECLKKQFEQVVKEQN
jgi:ClpX C4-type zinc finger.